MKMLLLSATVALAIAGPGFANDACADLEQLAVIVITAKQQGVPMSRAMAAIEGTVPIAQGRRLLRALVMDAYNLPDFASDEFRRQQVVEFRNAVSGICYKALNQAGALD